MKEVLLLDQNCSSEKLLKTIRNHYFNQSITFFTTRDNQPKLECFWYEIEANLLFFLNETQLHSKSVFALSSSRLDTENVFCLADGILTMNVTKERYYGIGLQGKKSRLVQDRFVIQINLLGPSFKKGSKEYNRVEWCFQNTLTEKLKFKISSVNSDGQSQKITFPEEVTYTVYKPQITQKLTNDQIYYPDFCRGKDDKQFLTESYEWIGLAGFQSQRIHTSDGVDDYIASYSPPNPNIQIKKLNIYKMVGFFAPPLIEAVYKAGPDILSVCGFEHSPLGFDKHENTNLNGGENDYVVVSLNEQQILYQAIKFFA